MGKDKLEGGFLISKSSDLMGNFKALVWNCGGLRSSSPNSLKKTYYFEKTY